MKIQSFDARTGTPNGEAWAESSTAYIEAAVTEAAAAFDRFSQTNDRERAALLRSIAEGLEAHAESLIALADIETGLGEIRLRGEINRTTYQLRGFADAIQAGRFSGVLSEEAVPGTPPNGRPRLSRIQVPIGPVAMFAASNFPFAFSVAGGDTASALAVGCPVVVKAHPAHPKLSREVGLIVCTAVEKCGLPAGVFRLVEGGSVQVGVALVKATGIAAVAFTGSLAGGMALARIAAERATPIPFYGELGSLNPVVVAPEVRRDLAVKLGDELADSIAAGSGQFCTSPGVILVHHNDIGEALVSALVESLERKALHVMLTPGIRRAFEDGVSKLRAHPAVRQLTKTEQTGENSLPMAFLAQVDVRDFIESPELRHEVFGSAALIVRVRSTKDVVSALRAIGGTLTVTLRGFGPAPEPHSEVAAIVRAAIGIAGRVLFEGVPTGVAVSEVQHHGGPFPASTAAASTSVGYAAAQRFLRPVALQDAPAWVLAG